jgi:hypothetical protein
MKPERRRVLRTCIRCGTGFMERLEAPDSEICFQCAWREKLAESLKGSLYPDES